MTYWLDDDRIVKVRLDSIKAVAEAQDDPEHRCVELLVQFLDGPAKLRVRGKFEQIYTEWQRELEKAEPGGTRHGE